MTKTTAPHPAAERLTSFSWGKLDDAESSEIAAHLVTCADCQKAVETLPDDALVSLVRKVVTKTLAKASTVTLVESWIPTELLAHPRYRLVRWLGAGGMGVVYQAEHRLMERPVAIKIISKTLTDNANTVARFQKEVKAAAKLSHPNIVTAYDAEQAGDLHFLVMEFIEGKSLNRLVEDGVPLPVKLACKYVRQAVLGLQHAFEQGLVHRDIKPQNLMLTPKGQVKILDFGLAGFVTESGPVGSLTESGQGLGTPDYIAPEQIRDTHSADIRADIYSLGCTLYCLLTGQPPFPDGSASQKLVAHLERMPKDISSLRPDLPVELALIVERMMEKRPAHRYQNPFEVAEALAPFAKGDDKVRPGSNSSHPSKLKAYLICAGVLGGVIGCIFLFDLPGKLSPFGKPQQASVVPKEEKEKGVEVPKEAKEKDPQKANAWGHLDTIEIKIMDGFFHVPKGKGVATKETFAGPIEIKVVARLEGNDIRLAGFAGGMVVFNNHSNPKQLLLHRPDGDDVGKGLTIVQAPFQPLSPNTWYTLKWRIDNQGMTVTVDDTVVYSEKGRKYNFAAAKRQISFLAVGTAADVKSFDVGHL